MNEYTCTECGRVCVYATSLPEIEATCFCVKGKTKQKKGVHKIGDTNKQGSEDEVILPPPTGPAMKPLEAPKIDNRPTAKVIPATKHKLL